GSTPAEAIPAGADAVPYRLAVGEHEIEPALGGADVNRAGRVTAGKAHGRARDRARSAGHAGSEETGAATHDVARVIKEELGLRPAGPGQQRQCRKQQSKSPGHFSSSRKNLNMQETGHNCGDRASNEPVSPAIFERRG